MWILLIILLAIIGVVYYSGLQCLCRCTCIMAYNDYDKQAIWKQLMRHHDILYLCLDQQAYIYIYTDIGIHYCVLKSCVDVISHKSCFVCSLSSWLAE